MAFSSYFKKRYQRRRVPYSRKRYARAALYGSYALKKAVYDSTVGSLSTPQGKSFKWTVCIKTAPATDGNTTIVLPMSLAFASTVSGGNGVATGSTGAGYNAQIGDIAYYSEDNTVLTASAVQLGKLLATYQAVRIVGFTATIIVDKSWTDNSAHGPWVSYPYCSLDGSDSSVTSWTQIGTEINRSEAVIHPAESTTIVRSFVVPNTFPFNQVLDLEHSGTNAEVAMPAQVTANYMRSGLVFLVDGAASDTAKPFTVVVEYDMVVLDSRYGTGYSSSFNTASKVLVSGPDSVVTDAKSIGNLPGPNVRTGLGLSGGWVRKR